RVGATGLDFEVEGAGQFGTVGRGDIAAWMLTTEVGYTLPVPSLSPRVYLEFDYASGDDRPGGNVGTFNQLYPNGHSFLGYIDYIGRQNIISPSAGITISPIRDLTLSVQQYFFWRASDRDALYTKSGAVLRPGTGTTARYVGAEIDLLATYNFTRHVQFFAQAQYKYGLVDYLIVIDAERTLLANELSLALAVNLQIGASIQLIKALGGGWNPSEDGPRQ